MTVSLLTAQASATASTHTAVRAKNCGSVGIGSTNAQYASGIVLRDTTKTCGFARSLTNRVLKLLNRGFRSSVAVGTFRGVRGMRCDLSRPRFICAGYGRSGQTYFTIHDNYGD